jgi:putative hydrolase of the HAD superfamily
MIKAILFDLVGVLVFKKEGFVPKTTDEINTQNIEDLFNQVDDKKLMRDVKEKLKLTDEEIQRALPLIPEKYEKFEKLWNHLPDLKKKYKIAVINNGNAVAMKFWQDKFNFSIFILFVNSAIEGIKKPDPGIFLLTCKRLSVKPEECVFMDDSPENIEAAKKLGMETIWWNKEIDRGELLNEFITKYGTQR